ncbi:MAG: hypothetical protein ABSG43_29015 [Solirubrobacteraceae bacterium]
MVPQLVARVDGLPVSLPDREVVWPIPDGERERARYVVPARTRARIARRTAAVHAAVTPRFAHTVIDAGASPYLDELAEADEILAAFEQAGLV